MNIVTRYKLRDKVNVFNLISLPTKEPIVFTVIGIWKWPTHTSYRLICDSNSKEFTCNKTHLMKLVKKYENIQ